MQLTTRILSPHAQSATFPRPSVSPNLLSALPISSSYTVHASAELIAFLDILNPNPSKKALMPSSRSINIAARKAFLYLVGWSWMRVLTASKGLVREVARAAARTEEEALIVAGVERRVVVVGVGVGDWAEPGAGAAAGESRRLNLVLAAS